MKDRFTRRLGRAWRYLRHDTRLDDALVMLAEFERLTGQFAIEVVSVDNVAALVREKRPNHTEADIHRVCLTATRKVTSRAQGQYREIERKLAHDASYLAVMELDEEVRLAAGT